MNKEKSIYACYEEIKQREISELKERLEKFENKEYRFAENHPTICINDGFPHDVYVSVVRLEENGHLYILGFDRKCGQDIDIDTDDIIYGHIEFITDAIPKQPPFLKQYFELKEKYHDALLLFRCGDFYETYEEDAVNASKTLGITLTYRNREFKSPREKGAMAGFPHHALDTYLPKLIRAGYRVAIVDELEDPRFKKAVKRGITELVK